MRFRIFWCSPDADLCDSSARALVKIKSHGSHFHLPPTPSRGSELRRGLPRVFAIFAPKGGTELTLRRCG